MHVHTPGDRNNTVEDHNSTDNEIIIIVVNWLVMQSLPGGRG